ncbi:hypothetical protein SAMN03159382_05524 [Pseudomonas sp. NFACC23-1]|nr:hypothetical protein SAMN03159386_05533 [Pseudomonas sp. NFACC17-2]SEJ94452.1 hypothetical protein SAMN03159382_05524 [Pseudomonas sp. NFACC23-1]SFW92831.1 hypothetical protein SAMN05660640_05739 [Pseudomonas sp. NFACC16-2]
MQLKSFLKTEGCILFDESLLPLDREAIAKGAVAQPSGSKLPRPKKRRQARGN